MRTLRLILFLGAVFGAAVSCEATVQIIGGSTASSNLVNNATGYLSLSQNGFTEQSSANGDSYALMPTAGTLWNLCANVVTAPGASNGWEFAFYKNGSAQTTTLTIAGAGSKQACDTVDAVHLAQGDMVAIQKTIQSGAPAASPASWCMFFTPDVPGETVLFGGGISQTAAANWGLSGSGINGATGVESSIYLPVPAAGTLKKMCGKVTVAAGTGNSWTWTMHDGGSAMAPSLTVTSANTAALQCDATDAPAVAAGDNIDVAVTVAGTPASTDISFGVVFVPNIAGQFIISNVRIGSLNASSNTYVGAMGRVQGNATESNAAQIWLACTIQAIYVYTPTDPGAGKTLEFELRNAGSTASLNATITHSVQNPNTTGASIFISNLSTIDTLVVPAGTPTLPASAAVSYLGYIPPQVPSQIY